MLGFGTAALCLLNACGPIARPYYVRSAGGYVTPTPSRTPTAAVPKDLPYYAGTAGDDEADAKGLSAQGARIRKIAEAYLGVPYKFAGQSRFGMDCSGFLRQVFQEAQGLDLPHSSSAIYRLGKPVAREDLQVGDLVFFKVMGFIDHGGIYMGGNYFIHSATSVGVSYSTLDAPYFVDHYAGARRLIDSAAP